MEWQPIETAPKDGRRVDLWLSSPDGVEQWRETNCWWSDVYKLWFNLRGRWDCATHWMPLPEPPWNKGKGMTPAELRTYKTRKQREYRARERRANA